MSEDNDPQLLCAAEQQTEAKDQVHLRMSKNILNKNFGVPSQYPDLNPTEML